MLACPRSIPRLALLLCLACTVPAADRAAAQRDDSSTATSAADGLIASIRQETLRRNRDGQGTTWFHPRACMIPGTAGQPRALMTMQEIAGSDYFGPVQWSQSDDFGKTWSSPEPIPAFGRDPVPAHPGLQAAVCDVTPEYHPPTDTVLALGHVVFYRGPRFATSE
ncbi:MAG: hypothetical protein KDA45_12055, partial [Planctomycetales bacterium]|nr:hypothetical protein [Planctomycetales bacterium]